MTRTRGVNPILLLLFVLSTNVFGREPTLVIDNFSIDSPTIVIVISTSTSFPVILTNFVDTTSSNIIGGERDLQLTVATGKSGEVIATSVSQGEFTLSSPSGSSSYAILQYDGYDASMDLNTTGLQSIPGVTPPGIDFLQNNGSFFNITHESDADTEGYIYVYDIHSGVCYSHVEYAATSNKETHLLSFQSFQGDCDFHLVGAIEFFFNALTNIDLIIMELSIVPPSTSTPSINTLIIDDFTVDQETLALVTSSTTSYPITQAGYQQDATQTHILGGERDMGVIITSGDPNEVVAVAVEGNAFSYSTASGTTGFSVLQYDGVDGSMNVNVTGLTSFPGASSGLNLENNNGNAFNITYMTDVSLVITIKVWDISAGECLVQLPVVAGESVSLIPFNTFTGNCNFQKVGAIELDISAVTDVDFELFFFSVTSSAAPPSKR